MPPLPFQINLDGYTCDEEYRGGFHGTIENRSTDTIELAGVCYFSFYMRTSGWMEYDLVTSPDISCYNPITITPGEILELNPTRTRLVCDETYVISVPYSVQLITTETEGRVYHQMYSNTFDVGDAPEGIVGGLYFAQITFHLPAPRVTFVNNSTLSDWVIPVCANEIVKWASTLDTPGWYPYATLERATDWGTWDVIVPNTEECTIDIDLIEIPRQSIKTVTLWEGVNFDVEDLEPGWYRWHVVYYGTKPKVGLLDSPSHRFSEIFEIRK